eukprot:4191652-Amphidinium_carterae.1
MDTLIIKTRGYMFLPFLILGRLRPCHLCGGPSTMIMPGQPTFAKPPSLNCRAQWEIASLGQV